MHLVFFKVTYYVFYVYYLQNASKTGYDQIILLEILISDFLPLSSSHSSTTRPRRYGIRCLAIARRSLSLWPLKFKETFHWLQSGRSKVKRSFLMLELYNCTRVLIFKTFPGYLKQKKVYCNII